MKSFLSQLRVWCFVLLAALAVGSAGCSKDEGVVGGPKMTVADATKALKAEDSAARQDAAIALGAKGEGAASAVPALIEAVKDQDPEVRRLAAYALGQIGPKAIAAVPALKELTKDAERNVYTAAVNAIQQIDPKSAKEKIVNTTDKLQ